MRVHPCRLTKADGRASRASHVWQRDGGFGGSMVMLLNTAEKGGQQRAQGGARLRFPAPAPT